QAAAEKAAVARQNEERAAAEKKALEKKRIDDAAAAKKAAEEKARLAREAELRRSLEAEARGAAIRNSDEAARWQAQIVARIARAWIKPPSAQPGISCIVSVTQVPGGEVTAVRVNSCSINDAALRESVEAAVLRASPLPAPPDPALFERNLELTFAPTS
ncbi:MAG: cell envelope integrity protein TolA, partial [Pseudomonadota bacterium]